jgi:hypothetical protein
MPEVRSVLDRHLDPAQDPSLAIRSVYGRWFPWIQLIDDGWAAESISRIFPPDEGGRPYWEAAWESYISFCPVWDRPFQLLEGEYRRAIERLSAVVLERKQPHGVNTHLAEHLMILYWRGKIKLASGGLLEAFYAAADSELRTWAAWFIGRSLQDIPADGGEATPADVPPEVVDRLMALWASRLREAQTASEIDPYINELAGFGWWYASGVFDETWALEQLIEALRINGKLDSSHLVIDRLAIDVESNPRLAVEALELMIKSDKEGWNVLPYHDEVTAVLKCGLRAADPEARSLALDVVHQLGARGFRDYRSLIARGGNGS